MDLDTAIDTASRSADRAAASADAVTARTNWPEMARDAARHRDALIWLRDHPGALPPIEYRRIIVASGCCPAETLALIAADDESSQDTLDYVIRADSALRGAVADTLSRRPGYTPAIIEMWRHG